MLFNCVTWIWIEVRKITRSLSVRLFREPTSLLKIWGNRGGKWNFSRTISDPVCPRSFHASTRILSIGALYATDWCSSSTAITSNLFACNNPSPVSERRAGKEKAVKLAPFKFPFSKMSKSRSSDKEEREKDKEKELEGKMEREKRHGKGTGRDSETEEEEEEEENPEDEEENARGQNVQLPMSQLQLSRGETQSNINSPILGSNSVMVRNEQAIPSSPPPSYEHVIEQVRIWI